MTENTKDQNHNNTDREESTAHDHTAGSTIGKETAEESGTCPNCEEYKAGWARARADYQNLVKETNDRRSELVRMSRLQVLEDFLPIYTNFRTAFTTEVKDGQWESWKQGIEYIMKQYGDTLKQHGVEEIETVGREFDPALHEAALEEESEEAPGTIIREVSAGYRMGDRVVQVARVVVAK